MYKQLIQTGVFDYQHSNAMIAELYEAILKACAGHAGMLVGVASASGANSLKQMS